MTPEELRSLLRKAWSKETTNDPHNWTPENPAWGQCVPTALVAQDFFGGKILQTIVRIKKENHPPEVSHFWNRLPDGREIDFTKEQLPNDAEILEDEIKTISRHGLFRIQNVRKRYAILRLAVENLIQPNPLFSDPIYQKCLEVSQASECQKMKFGCAVLYRQGRKEKLVAIATNKILEPLRSFCEPECIRLKIQSRTESMLGACGHAEEWALWLTIGLGIPLSGCSFYIAGFNTKDSNKPWLKKEKEHTCLRCTVQMYMAGVGKIYVPVVDHWEWLTSREALETSKAYALKEKKI